jgi:hypothetical protein
VSKGGYSNVVARSGVIPNSLLSFTTNFFVSMSCLRLSRVSGVLGTELKRKNDVLSSNVHCFVTDVPKIFTDVHWYCYYRRA